MFDTRSAYALNRVNKSAIVCPSATGNHIHLAREDFVSEEEFAFWKAWSDEDYHKIEITGQNDDRRLSLDAQRDTPVQSAEDVILIPYMAKEKEKQRQKLQENLKRLLTETQYRRIRLYYLEGKDEQEIASLEGVNQSSVSRSIRSGTKIVEQFFGKILCRTA